MKVLNPILIGLLVVGCGKNKQPTNTNESNNTPGKPAKQKVEKITPSTNTTVEPAKKLSLREKLVGSYECNFDGIASKLVFLENGKVKTNFNGLKIDEVTWNISGTEVHIGEGNPIDVYKIESNGDLTFIAKIADGKRKEESKERYCRSSIGR